MPRKMRRFFVRLTQPSFTVSAVAVIFNDSKEVLLLRHVIRANSSGWGLPGGFLNAGEQPEIAVRRELREEVGIETTDVKLLKVRTAGNHFEIIYLCRAENTDVKPKSGEIIEVGWFRFDELQTKIPPIEIEHIALARKISEKLQN
jgi:mutator protein MutT